jgi:septal ring factor EnvC (AmiA/AmiB activator)
MAKKTIDEQIAATEKRISELNAKLKALHKRKTAKEDEQRLTAAKRLAGLMKAKNIIPDEGTLDELVENMVSRSSEHSPLKCEKVTNENELNTP